MKYYIVENNDRLGPFSIDELAAKDITANTLVWTENMVDWQPASSIEELQHIIKKVPQDIPAPPYNATPKKKKGMSGCLKFFIFGIIVLALITGAAALTNPSKEAHQKELSEILSQAIKESISKENTSGLNLNAIYDKVIPKVIENVSNELLEYNNYGIFSTCNLKTDENKRATIGVFGKVYTLDKEDVKKAIQDAVKNMNTLKDNLPDLGI